MSMSAPRSRAPLGLYDARRPTPRPLAVQSRDCRSDDGEVWKGVMRAPAERLVGRSRERKIRKGSPHSSILFWSIPHFAGTAIPQGAEPLRMTVGVGDSNDT